MIPAVKMSWGITINWRKSRLLCYQFARLIRPSVVMQTSANCIFFVRFFNFVIHVSKRKLISWDRYGARCPKPILSNSRLETQFITRKPRLSFMFELRQLYYNLHKLLIPGIILIETSWNNSRRKQNNVSHYVLTEQIPACRTSKELKRWIEMFI